MIEQTVSTRSTQERLLDLYSGPMPVLVDGSSPRALSAYLGYYRRFLIWRVSRAMVADPQMHEDAARYVRLADEIQDLRNDPASEGRLKIWIEADERSYQVIGERYNSSQSERWRGVIFRALVSDMEEINRYSENARGRS